MYQRRAIFDMVCAIIVVAFAIALIGTFVGCANGTHADDAFALPTAPPDAVARVSPEIIRIDANRCGIVTSADAVWYEQAGITRPMFATFACPVKGLAKERWGSGSRMIVVQYNDGSRERLEEWWPDYRVSKDRGHRDQ
jgi:hypothetical protein